MTDLMVRVPGPAVIALANALGMIRRSESGGTAALVEAADAVISGMVPA